MSGQAGERLVRRIEAQVRALQRAEVGRDAAIIEAYTAGVGPAELARAAGTTRPTVYRILREAGVPLRTRSGDRSSGDQS